MKSLSTTDAAPYTVSPELQTAADAIEAARAQCKKLAEQVDTTAAHALTLEADLKSLTAERAAEEGALALCEPGDVKRHEKTIDRLTAELELKERDLRRARTKIVALESMAPDLDSAVKAAGVELQAALAIWAQQATRTLADEIAEAAKPLAAVMARAQALALAGGNLADFVTAAYCPSPEGFRRVWSSAGWANQGENLLTGVQTPEADAIAEPVRAIAASISAARYHSNFVPLARRPKFPAPRVEAAAPAPMAEVTS
ncbi:hypothetical protein [Variovorax sp. PBL-E5]|uniref:hypothetical protein n=1 Tax=Variovorax sp. PBL-E5 TaxID=434014 RepID=UPI0013174291|nr:hypothetical protein [Variovorax sp. PBL-E5]VTU36218.1 hypothetical protein E5CHR_04258 [Variovorax sp. PBL-E5]